MRRYLPFVLIALVALVTVGVATAVYRSKMRPAPAASATSSPVPTVTNEAANEKEEESIHARGPRTAPVSMEVYGDFQCPSCAVATAMIDDLQKEYGDKMRVIFHEFPLAMHKHAVAAAMAAEAAGLQGHFWEMHDMLYKYQSIWSRASTTNAFFDAYAESIGLDAGRFAMDSRSPELQARIISEGDAGTARGVKNTPTIFLNGHEVQNGFQRENLKQAIDAVLAGKKKS
ncbi:MAG: DsbA family protein [Chthoniobacterales bacterium]